MSNVFVLSHPEARRRAMEAVRTAPDSWVVSLHEPQRTGPQNKALHATLTEIARACKWAGSTWEMEVWKRLMTAAWMRATAQPVIVLPALDGMGMDVVYRRTSHLSVSECNSLLEFTRAWAAEHAPEGGA
jgi:hypothetical protein